MDGSLLPRGILLGLAITAPVGPIGVLCISRTLSAGRAMGFATGLGAATADAVYGAVAAFGLTAVSSSATSASPRSAPGRPLRRVPLGGSPRGHPARPG